MDQLEISTALWVSVTVAAVEFVCIVLLGVCLSYSRKGKHGESCCGPKKPAVEMKQKQPAKQVNKRNSPNGIERKSKMAVQPVSSWEIDSRKIKMKDKIGVGNFGEVWLANWLGLVVAVKTILPSMLENQEFTNRFVDEIHLMR